MGLESLSPAGSVVVGVFVGLLSTSVQSLGLTLQRKSHILEDEKGPHDVRRPPHKRTRWQLGMGMFIISNLVGSTIQITTLPLPVLSTLQASGLVFNSICATLILGESFTRWSLGGTLLVCGGAVLIAIFGAIPEPAHNLDQLLDLLGRHQFILWMAAQAMIVVLIVLGTKLLMLLYPRANNNPRMRLLRGMAYGAISGILSAHSLLVAKSAVELLVRTIIDRINQFNRWQSWMVLLGLIFLALSQLYYLHRGLKLCSTSILYPFVFCIYNIIAILDGLIYFKQVSRLSAVSALLIALGTMILLAGVLALSWRLNNDPTIQPVVPSTGLGPGMGFVDDTDEEHSDDADTQSGYTSTTEDEEALRNTERRALPSSNDGSATRIMTPTTKDNTILNVTKSRRQGMTEAAEIWGELEDDGKRGYSPSPYRERRASAMSLPSRSRRGTINQDDGPNEATALLRRSTGRGFGGRRRMSARLSERRGSAPSQDALGGWWKMRWWKRRKDGDSGPREGDG